MRAIPRRGVGILAALAILAVLAVPKLFSFARRPRRRRTGKEDLRVRAHRVVSDPAHRAADDHRHCSRQRGGRDRQRDLRQDLRPSISRRGAGSPRGELLLKIDDSELVAERQRALYRVELAERAEARQKQLLDDGVISSETYDVALGELNVLRAELQLIEAQLLKTEIRAPFGGVIGLRWVSPGSYLSSQTRIASLNDLDPVKFDFTVPEKYSALMKVGDEISFAVEGFDRTFPGTIYAVEPSVDATTRSLRVRARCPNNDGALIPGVFANVDLVLRSIPDALTVPSIAVIPELGGKKVFVFEDGAAQPRTVETGIRSESAVQITSGLAEGDIVIISGLLQLQPGLEVEIEEIPAAAGSAS